MENKLAENKWLHILIIVLIGCLLFFSKLGSYDLNYAEAREGQVVLEMHKTGNIVLPLRNGKIIPSKPPFFHWIGLIISNITGTIDEFSVRAPSALFGILSIIVVYFIGMEFFSVKTGFLSAIFLASCSGFIKLAREARVDMALNFFISLALLFFIIGYKNENKRKLFFVLYFVASSFATLAKGPVGFALPAIIVIIFLASEKKIKLIFGKETIIGILIFIAISSLWYILAIFQNGEMFFQKQVMTENINRFLGRKGGYGHENPFYYYFPRIFTVLIPWSVFLPAAFYNIYLKNFREKVKEDRIGNELQNGNKFLIIWLLSILIFFSIAASKRTDYLLPLIPAGAILIASLWNDFLSSKNKNFLEKTMSFSVLIFPLLAVLSSLIIIVFFKLYSPDITIHPLLQTFMKQRDIVKSSFYFSIFYKDFIFNLAFAVFLLFSGIFTFWFTVRKNWKISLVALTIFVLITMNVAYSKYFPVVEGDFYIKDFAIKVTKSIKDKDNLFFYNLEKNLTLKHSVYNGLIFYTSRHIRNLDDSDIQKLEPDQFPVYLIMGIKNLEHLKRLGFKAQVREKSSNLVGFRYTLLLVKLEAKKEY